MKSLIKKSKALRLIKSGILEILSIGGNTKSNMIFPKGLYANPKDTNAITMQIISDEGNTVTIPLQKVVDLKVGQVIVTDDKSYIKFKNDGTIEIKGETTFLDDVIMIKKLNVTSDITCLANGIYSGALSASNYTGVSGGDMSTTSNIISTGEITASGIPVTNHGHPYTWTDGAGSGTSGTPTSL